MPFRAGLFLFVAVLFASGCRDPLVPNVDLNHAPETWITAAPQDTITTRDGGAVSHSPIGTIPVKFRMYWAGSDRDGFVVGFYWAVVETIPIPPPGLPLPNLPGPKPQDYRYTTKTDSTFVFSVSESSPDRQHAFFIYAVDNRGEADPTPARVIFNALDRFPPIPVIDYATGALGTGKIYTQTAAGVWERDTVVAVTDSLTLQNFAFAPRDTVPMTARLDFRWRGEPAIVGTYVAGYRYKMDEPEFVAVDSSVTTVSYNTGVGNDVSGPGRKVFTLRAVDQAGGSREITRKFQLNYAPDTWFAGPDSTQPIWSFDGRDRYYDVTNWSALPPFVGSLLSCDSIRTWPAERKQNKTFFEIYKNRLYVRSEFDTVHLNSWVIFHAGGSDLDSPYNVVVTDLDRTRDTVVCAPAKTLRPGPQNGSPVGVHGFIGTQIEFGAYSAPAQTGLIPVFDATSVFRAPLIGVYGEMRRAGTAYAVMRSDDGQGSFDNRINARADRLAATVDAGLGNPQEQALRSRVIKYYIGKAPELLTSSPTFIPRPGEVFRSRQIDLTLPATDEDPYDPETAPVNTGGPSTSMVLRYTVKVRGLNARGDTVVVTPMPEQSFSPNITVHMPNEVVAGTILIDVQVCDCASCELITGSGRCRNYRFIADYQPTTPAAASEAPAGGAIGDTHEDRGHTSRGSNP